MTIRARDREGKVKEKLVRIAANFGFSMLGETLSYWAERMRSGLRVKALEHDQALPFLSRLASGASIPSEVYSVILVNPSNWLGTETDRQKRANALDEHMRVLVNTLEVALTRGGQFIVAFLPVKSESEPTQILERTCHWREKVAKLARIASNLHELRLDHIALSYDIPAVFSAHSEASVAVPYTVEYEAAVGTELMRLLASLEGMQCKCIVVDCDNTLWRGECGAVEEPQALEILGSCLTLQRYLVDCRKNGILICVCSKNEEADVRRVFESHPAMLLQIDDIAQWECSWGRKSQGIKRLSKGLGLELAAFVFIDDDSFECAEVRFECPSVTVVQPSPDAGEMLKVVSNIWSTDRRDITLEDAARTAWYRTDLHRRKIQKQAVGLDSFLREIELRTAVEEISVEDARVVQLAQRTTQYNTRKGPLSRARFWALAEAVTPGCTYAVRVQDRYGTYGLVGSFAGRVDGDAYVVMLFFLSCRVLGRRVECSMVAAMLADARRHSCERIKIPFERTTRNGICWESLRQFGFEAERETGEEVMLIGWAGALAERLIEQPYGYSVVGDAKIGEIDATESDSVLTSASMTETEDFSEDRQLIDRASTLSDIAAYLNRSTAIAQAVVVWSAKEMPLQQIVNPRTPTELAVQAIWRSVLGIEEIGIDVDFFDIQADSLRAVRVLARVKHRFGVELPISLLFEGAFTIASLACVIDLALIEAADPSLVKQELARLQEMSDEEVRAALNPLK